MILVTGLPEILRLRRKQTKRGGKRRGDESRKGGKEKNLKILAMMKRMTLPAIHQGLFPLNNLELNGVKMRNISPKLRFIKTVPLSTL